MPIILSQGVGMFERGEGAISGRGRGRGRGQAAIASARALASSRTRTREVRTAQRMDA